MGVLSAGLYLVGVLLGLLKVDGPPSTRVALALLWPLGPLAFLLTIGLLVVVAAIAFPVFGALLAAGLAAWALLG